MLDLVYGAPMVAALKATRWGARIMTSAPAGLAVQLDMPDMLFRTQTSVGTGQRPPADRHAIWERLLRCPRRQTSPSTPHHFTLRPAAEAWTAQAGSPHAKIVATVQD